MRHWLLSAFAAILALGGWNIAVAQKVGDRQGYEFVELDPPAIIEIVPMVDGPLLRGEEMQFRVAFDRAPEPITMWSMRVDYTSPTLTFKSLQSISQDNQSAVVISDPYVLEPGWESRSVSGISLTGWPNGDVLKLAFTVKGDAPEAGSIKLSRHPTVREGLAHDSIEKFKTFDYKRDFVYAKTTALPVVDVGDGHQPYVFPEARPRVLFQRQKADPPSGTGTNPEP